MISSCWAYECKCLVCIFVPTCLKVAVKLLLHKMITRSSGIMLHNLGNQLQLAYAVCTYKCHHENDLFMFKIRLRRRTRINTSLNFWSSNYTTNSKICLKYKSFTYLYQVGNSASQLTISGDGSFPCIRLPFVRDI